MDIIKSLLPNDDPKSIEHLTSIFRDHYDHQAYQTTTEYDGITKALKTISKYDLSLYIATNKPIIPTNKLIKLFSWEHLFTSVYSLNSFNPPKPTKSELLKAVCIDNGIPPIKALYVGDRQEDRQAAYATGMRFEMVQWGYDPQNVIADDTTIISTPERLAQIIDHHLRCLPNDSHIL